jgi:hypothetical protein
MRDAPSPWCQDEPGYVAYLANERALYAWCLVRHGAYTAEAATHEATQFYTYEPPEHPYRGLIFQSEAWHYAMVKLFGAKYWLTHSDFQGPSPEYREEARRLDGR